MGKKVFIAEKPELGKAIADALSERQKYKKGYIELDDNVIVTWAFGHLLKLKTPEEHNPKYKQWNLNDLPLQINNYKMKPIEEKKEQLKLIENLTKNCQTIVHAGDPDEEGQLLIDEILDYIGFKGKVLRLLINDNTIQAVRKSLTNLEENNIYKPLKDSAYFRSICDYEYGMNFTRAYSANKTLTTVGRVQTPILNLIHLREKEVAGHIKNKYFSLTADKTFKFCIPKENLENGICTDENYLKNIKENSKKVNDFKIYSIKKIRVFEYSPLAYNLLELQADCFKLYKYNPTQVKTITQSLREKHKAITYNRSDCQYLSMAHYEQRNELLDVLMGSLNCITKYQNIGKLINREQKHQAFNDKNITAHHGIIPTLNCSNITSFTTEEKNVFFMIADRYLMLFMPPRIIDRYFYYAKNTEGLEYEAKNSITKDIGYTAFFTTVIKQTETQIKDYKEGDFCNFENFNIVEAETKPKQLYTYGTLLKDLTSVSKYIKNPILKEALLLKDKNKKGERGGIGTPATRDSIIKLLIDREYIKEEKNKLLTTSKGIALLEELPELAKTPDITAEWANIQTDIKTQSITVNQAIQLVKDQILQEINKLKEQTEYTKCPSCATGTLRRIPGKYGYFWGCSNFNNKKSPCGKMFKDLNNKPLLINKLKKGY